MHSAGSEVQLHRQWRVSHLHEVADVLTVWEDLGEILGSEHSTQRRLSEQPRRPRRVFHVHYWHRRIRHAVVDDRIHRYCNWILWQDLSSTHVHQHTHHLELWLTIHMIQDWNKTEIRKPIRSKGSRHGCLRPVIDWRRHKKERNTYNK